MRRLGITILTLATLFALSCSEVNRDPSPVELVATTSQDITIVDLAGGEGCDQNLGTITLRAIQKNQNRDSTAFLAVDLERMRVSYVRTDGGTLVPASFVQTIDGLIEVGTTGATLNDFIVFQNDALNQAPFAALFPQNGGFDPETGRQSVSLDVVVEIFGETLGGDEVAATTRFPLEFCYNCGGCR
ncbi:MAG: hypothetical protein R3338_04350 [Thermoanaerobaculia bacterium]|nr:hypothetical protein [Thermoanaerobaculia bacterium]